MQPLLVLSFALAPLLTAGSLPPFSWETVPYHVHCANNSGPVNAAVLALQANASFTVIQCQQGMWVNASGGVDKALCADERREDECAATGAEAKMAAAAARIRAQNAAAHVILYHTYTNAPVARAAQALLLLLLLLCCSRCPLLILPARCRCDVVRVETDFGRGLIEKSPNLLLKRVDAKSGSVTAYRYDWSQDAMVTAWANGVAAAVKLGKFDGVFIDGYDGWHDCWTIANSSSSSPAEHRSGCPGLLPKNAVPATAGRGKINASKFMHNMLFKSGVALKAALPAGSLLIPNCEGGYGCRRNGTGGQTSRLPGYNGIMEEFFGLYGQLPNQTDGQNGKGPFDDESIASLAKLDGEMVGQINWTDEKDKNTAIQALAGFLIGAQRNQYFGVIGWHWNCAEIPAATLAPLYKKPLGAPLARAALVQTPIVGIKGGVELVYTRQFAHGVKVMLNVSHGTGPRTHPQSWVRCCITWGDGTNSSCAPGDCMGVAPHRALKLKADDDAKATAAAAGAHACPPAPKGVHTRGVHKPVSFTLSPGSCISSAKCTAAHCSCDSQHLDNSTCTSAADCAEKAAVQCLADASCHSFAFQGSCNKSSGMMWKTFRFGGKGSAVANSDWQAYWRPGTSLGPCDPGDRVDPGDPGDPCDHSFPSIPVHAAAVPTLISGNWTGPTDALPDVKIPSNPLVGNGYTGLIVDGNTDFVSLHINTNSMWNVRPASGSWPVPGAAAPAGPKLSPVPTAHRVSLGGITFWALAENFTSFGAQQRIADGTLRTVQTTGKNEALTTSSVLHPQLQVTTTSLTWNGSTPLNVTVSTWAAVLTKCWQWRQCHDDHKTFYDSSAFCCDENGKARACSSAASVGMMHCTSRNASKSPSPKQIWGGLSTIIRGGIQTRNWNQLNVGNNETSMWGGSGQVVSVVSTSVTLEKGETLTTVTGLADSMFNSSAAASPPDGASPLPAAASVAFKNRPETIAAASAASWKEFWFASSVSTPTLPALEWCWYGSLYMTKGFASTDPSVPASGLFGPWVTSDQPGWCGDYTLDYNQETQLQHVYASGHPELAASYFGSILEYSSWSGKNNGVGKELANAVVEAARLNGTCPEGYGILFPCAIAPWGFMSDDLERYNFFNGMYASMLFLNDYEYTLNATFAKSTYELIAGFTEFWHCMLRPGADGMLHDGPYANDVMDSVFEGRRRRRLQTETSNDPMTTLLLIKHLLQTEASNDPVSSLSLIKRLATFQLRLAAELPGITAPKWLAEMAAKIAPFATAKNTAGDLVQVDSPSINVSNSVCAGSGACAVFYPVFPSELIDPLNASKATQALESATAVQYTSGLKKLGLAVFWPFVMRSTPRANAAQVVKGFIEDAAGRIGKNLIKYAPGGGTENAGLALAVADMLLRAPGGEFIVLFPTWPVAEPASFTNLLAKGGWRVSAEWEVPAKAAAGVTITNAAKGSGSRTCRLANPWAGAEAVKVSCGGKAASVASEGDLLAWSAPEGVACTVSK